MLNDVLTANKERLHSGFCFGFFSLVEMVGVLQEPPPTAACSNF